MEHRALTDMYLGAVQYRMRLERVCKDSSGAWLPKAKDFLKADLAAWAQGSDKHWVEEFLFSKHSVEVAWACASDTQDAEFKAEIVHYLYTVYSKVVRAVDDLRRRNLGLPTDDRNLVERIYNELKEITDHSRNKGG